MYQAFTQQEPTVYKIWVAGMLCLDGVQVFGDTIETKVRGQILQAG